MNKCMRPFFLRRLAALACGCSAVLLLGFPAEIQAQQGSDTLSVDLVRYRFENVLERNAPKPLGVTIFSGNVGEYKEPGSANSAEVPHGGGIILAESGIGAPVSGGPPYGNFAAETIRQAQHLLYWTPNNVDREQAAFRYLVKLYGIDTSGPAANALAREAAMGSDEARQELSARAELQRKTIADLEELANTPVPTLDEMIAELAPGTKVTEQVRQVLEHQRAELQNKVSRGQRQLDALIGYDNRSHAARDSDAQSIRCNFENIATYYGAAERQRADQALTILRQALKYAPQDRSLSNAYLDVFYNKAVAELQTIKIDKAERAQYRLGLKSVPSGFVIDKEISILEGILAKYRSALSGLGTLLTERGAVDVREISNTAAPGTPLGYLIFQREQPIRNKLAAQYVDGNGNIQTVPRFDPVTSTTVADSGTRVLFNGYKDYVLVLGILANYLTDSADLARLYGMRGQETSTVHDRSSALALIRQVQQETEVEVRLLEAMFADYQPQPGDASGVMAGRHGVQAALGEIEGVRNFLLGTANALGFDPNFLVLVQESGPGSQKFFDSYDGLMSWMSNPEKKTGAYTYAEIEYNNAVLMYDKYRAASDELAMQLDDIDTEFSSRYQEIVGTSDPDDPVININHPAPGSELDQASVTIATLKQKARLLGDLTDNLSDSIADSTIYKDQVVPGKASGIGHILTQYKNSVSKEFDTITNATAAAAGAQAAFDTVSNVASTLAGSTDTPWSAIAGGVASAAITVAGAVNTAIQVTSALSEGNANKAIDAAQATFNANLALNDIATDKHDAAQELFSLRRDAISNSIDLLGVQSELAQAQAQYSKLVREAQDIIRKRDDNNKDLSDRYFADPIHQLNAQSAEISADIAFRQAQQWMFFAQRALEYKFNKPFVWSDGTNTYDSGTLMKVRNFKELSKLKQAITNFNDSFSINLVRNPASDKLSLKYNFFGLADNGRYTFTNQDGSTVTVDAEEAFRRRLAKLVNTKTGVLEIPLDTFSVKQTTESTTFFSGPVYNKLGGIIQAGKYADKIDWLKFNFVTAGVSTPHIIQGNFSYAGTSYLRTRTPACFNPNNDRVLPGEFMSFPFRYYRLTDTQRWVSLPSQDDTVSIVVSGSPTQPVDTDASPVYRNFFVKERSVAATQMKLSILASSVDLSRLKDIEIYVQHMSLSRDLPVCTSP